MSSPTQNPVANGRDPVKWTVALGHGVWPDVSSEGRRRLGGDAEATLMAYDRITINPKQMGGLPCLRGLRIPVSTVIGQLAAGRTHDEILADFPDLEAADLFAALEYAAAAVQERELPPVPAG